MVLLRRPTVVGCIAGPHAVPCRDAAIACRATYMRHLHDGGRTASLLVTLGGAAAGRGPQALTARLHHLRPVPPNPAAGLLLAAARCNSSRLLSAAVQL